MTLATKQPTTAQVFTIGATDRALLVGQTGAGKSYLARALLTNWQHLLIIDEKGDFDFPRARLVRNPHDLGKLKIRDPSPILYRPQPEFWTLEDYDGVFRWVYERQNTSVYVDEIYAVMAGSPRGPRWMQACITRGRSLGIRMMMGTQRPASVPLSILTESEHRFMFALDWEDDLKRMAMLMGVEVLQPLKHKYGFYYFNRTIRPRQPAREYVLRKGSNHALDSVNGRL